MSKTLLGQEVKLDRPVALGAGENILDAGLKGNVVWDEGGESVIVKFADHVPNGGFPTGNACETWVPRNFLRPVGRADGDARGATSRKLKR